MRLQVYLSHSGVASRRASAKIISEGWVRVNGHIITSPGFNVSLTDEVIVYDSVISPDEEKIYIMLNKPLNCISANRDPQNRPTIMDIVQKSFPQRLFPVGRLDFNSTGLIFITNDGNFSHKLSHPRSQYIKRYRVHISSQIPIKNLEIWKRGISIDNSMYTLHNYNIINNKELIISLIEGKNREIRRVFEYFKTSVSSLHRFQFGSQCIGNLGLGKFRFLSNLEVSNLLSSAHEEMSK